MLSANGELRYGIFSLINVTSVRCCSTTSFVCNRRINQRVKSKINRNAVRTSALYVSQCCSSTKDYKRSIAVIHTKSHTYLKWKHLQSFTDREKNHPNANSDTKIGASKPMGYDQTANSYLRVLTPFGPSLWLQKVENWSRRANSASKRDKGWRRNSPISQPGGSCPPHSFTDHHHDRRVCSLSAIKDVFFWNFVNYAEIDYIMCFVTASC